MVQFWYSLSHHIYFLFHFLVILLKKHMLLYVKCFYVLYLYAAIYLNILLGSCLNTNYSSDKMY